MEQNIELDQEPVIIQQGGGAVNSVNGQTGDVVLTTSDLENTSDYQTGTEVQNAIDDAVSQIDIPTNVSELTNDAGYQDAQQVASAVAGEASLREAADTSLQGQIDAITASSDVTDIVGTYAALQAYDTSTLGNNDIIKVLQDESQNDETTYYRWSTTTQTFTLIGEEGPYYTKSAADSKFQDKLTAGSNISIGANNEISATDTTYSDFTGTDGQTAGTAGLVPAPATTDEGKFLSAGGAWGTPTDTTYTAGAGLVLTGTVFSGDVNYRALNGASAPTTATEAKYVGQLYYDTTGGDMYYCSAITPQGTDPETYTYTWVQLGGGSSVTVVQTTGTSTTDVMSQDATTKMIFPDITDKGTCIGIGKNLDISGGAPTGITIVGDSARGQGNSSTVIGQYAQSTGPATDGAIVIGGGGSYPASNAKVSAAGAIAIGGNARASAKGSVAFGKYASATTQGEMNIGSTVASYSYNNTGYRLLRGVHDGVQDHDAVTLGQLNARIVGSGTAAPTTSTAGSVGSLYAYVESGTGHLAICTDDTGGTYTWQTLV